MEVFLKLWNLRSYDKTNGEVTRVTRLLAVYQKVRKETEGCGDFKRLHKKTPEFPNERSETKISESMDSCFVARIAAVLQYTQFAYVDESTSRRMSNFATPKSGRFEDIWPSWIWRRLL